MRIRVTPPRIALPRNYKVQTYELQFQARQKDGSWKVKAGAKEKHQVGKANGKR